MFVGFLFQPSSLDPPRPLHASLQLVRPQSTGGATIHSPLYRRHPICHVPSSERLKWPNRKSPDAGSQPQRLCLAFISHISYLPTFTNLASFGEMRCSDDSQGQKKTHSTLVWSYPSMSLAIVSHRSSHTTDCNRASSPPNTGADKLLQFE
jgi:hypothetical protein